MVLACHVALSVSKIFIADSSLHPFLSIGTRALAPSSATALSSNMSILVCGTGAIGSAVARIVSRASARPILAGRDAAKLSALSAELAGAETRVVDFAVPEAVPEALGALPADLQGVVYAVGNARLQPMRALKPADLAADFALNCGSAFEVVRASAPAMKKRGGGGVVLFSTVAVGQGFSRHASVGAAKGAVEGLARSLAAELAPSRIRVNAVAPSLTAGAAIAAPLTSNAKMAEGIAAMHPLGRLGEADDSAEVAAFLVSERASWITGQVWGVDGGRSSLR